MLNKIFILLFISPLISCGQVNVKNSDSPGTLISNITFKVKTDNLTDFKQGYIPWVELDHPDLKQLIDKDEIVINEPKVILIIDYPITKECRFILTSQAGFTREQLVKAISDTYHKIYEEEEATATVKTIPADKREGLRNRNQTNGKYGITFHDLSDLALDDVEVYKAANGDILLGLDIDS
jgi:hypothetical protein